MGAKGQWSDDHNKHAIKLATRLNNGELSGVRAIFKLHLFTGLPSNVCESRTREIIDGLNSENENNKCIPGQICDYFEEAINECYQIRGFGSDDRSQPFAIYKQQGEKFPIKYCPFCGEKL